MNEHISKVSSLKTLAIGDGANDVMMILKANVGVGIFGNEGSEASRQADYAVSQFRFIKPLLFIHGREALRRNSFIIYMNLYKNAVVIFV